MSFITLSERVTMHRQQFNEEDSVPVMSIAWLLYIYSPTRLTTYLPVWRQSDRES
jgi:hypothetical protein